MTIISKKQHQAAKNIAVNCANLISSESALIIYEDQTADVAKVFELIIRQHGASVQMVRVAELNTHGEEPELQVARMMFSVDVIYALTWKSLAHTKARAQAAVLGARFLSLPEFSLALLDDPALLVNFQRYGELTNKLVKAFHDASKIQILSEAGTNLICDVTGRSGNSCPGWVSKPGDLGSPPDIEANISPIEDRSSGKIIVDGSIPFSGFGLLTNPIELIIENGNIKDIKGDPVVVKKLILLFDQYGSEKSRTLAECGFGLNPKARLTGNMLTDEGAFGTVHFGFGSNITVGGLNDVPFHLDFVCRSFRLLIDDLPMDIAGCGS